MKFSEMHIILAKLMVKSLQFQVKTGMERVFLLCMTLTVMVSMNFC